MRNFEQESDKEIERIDQQHKILIEIGREQRRVNSPERTNYVHSFDLFLAQKLHNIEQRLQKNETYSLAQEPKL